MNEFEWRMILASARRRRVSVKSFDDYRVGRQVVGLGLAFGFGIVAREEWRLSQLTVLQGLLGLYVALFLGILAWNVLDKREARVRHEAILEAV